MDCSDFDNNITERIYQFKHYPDDNKKKSWKKAAGKEITMKEFSRFICKRRDFDIVFGL